jgi:hypothetical protein
LINFSQRSNCFIVDDIAWPEGLMGKKLLTKKLDAREMTSGATVTSPTGKVSRVIFREDGEQVLHEVGI